MYTVERDLNFKIALISLFVKEGYLKRYWQHSGIFPCKGETGERFRNVDNPFDPSTKLRAGRLKGNHDECLRNP